MGRARPDGPLASRLEDQRMTALTVLPWVLYLVIMALVIAYVRWLLR